MQLANNTEREFLRAMKQLNHAGYLKLDSEWDANRSDRRAETSEIQKGKLYSLNQLMRVVSNQFGLDIDSIRGHSRKRELVEARQIFCYIAHHTIQCSYREIGAYLSGRDHSTVLYSVREAVPCLMYSYHGLETRIEYIIKLFKKTKNVVYAS